MTRLLLFAVILLTIPTPEALACTLEGSRLASQARQRSHLGMKRVKGVYRVIAKSETEEKDYFSTTNDKVVVVTFIGRITARRGVQYDTEHSDDGYVMSCPSRSSPIANAEGIFYLSKQKNKDFGRYGLEDRDGKYLRKPEDTHASPSTKKRS